MNFGQQSQVLSLHLAHRMQQDFFLPFFFVKKGASHMPSNTVYTNLVKSTHHFFSNPSLLYSLSQVK